MAARRIWGILVALALPLPAAAGPVIGQWCDQMAPDTTTMNRLITLTDEEGDVIHARTTFANGSRFTQSLVPGPGNMLIDPQAPGGEAFRLIGGGMLELLDSAGLQKAIPPIPFDADPASCFAGN